MPVAWPGGVMLLASATCATCAVRRIAFVLDPWAKDGLWLFAIRFGDTPLDPPSRGEFDCDFDYDSDFHFADSPIKGGNSIMISVSLIPP